MVFFVLSGQFMLTSSQTNEEHDRLIETPSFPDAPVKITRVKAKKGEVRVGEKFKDTNDWFKGLAVRVKNTSDKPVNYVSVLVIFTRPRAQKEEGRLPFGEPLVYGRSPADSKGPPPIPVPPIPPGEHIELNLPERYFDEYTALLKKLDFPESLSHMEISIQEVGFEDGLLWSGGVLWR